MAPVEGMKFSDDIFVVKFDSTEPGSPQSFLDLDPTCISVECDEPDTSGRIKIEQRRDGIKLLKKLKDGREKREYLGNSLSFSGPEIVYLQYLNPETNVTDEWVFWHLPESSKQPPYEAESVPLSPIPPLDEIVVELTPEKEKLLKPERGTTDEKVREAAEWVISRREPALRALENL